MKNVSRFVVAALALATLGALMAAVPPLIPSPATQPGSPVADGAKPEKLFDTFSFTEGPACDPDGNLFFTDQPNDTIYKYGTDHKLTAFLKPAGRSNGLCFDGNTLISCADETNQLWAITMDGKTTALITDYQGKLLNGPNDIWCLKPSAPGTPAGLYISDPLYKRDYWKRDPKTQQPGEYVYFLSADRKTLTPVITDLKKPNGIIGTADNKTLYVADIGANKTYSYTINADGTLTDKKQFCTMGSDGMTIDSDGNIYITGKGVTIFSPAGQKIGHIDIKEPWTANVAFGGTDRSTLFITASKCLYSIQMRTHGIGSQ